MPLQPGTAVTDTLQRWQLDEAAGGYRLTNAITRMAAHVTDAGRLLPYPKNQRSPAVWTLTAP
ncbi:hypothetical protein [Streptomyces formicae]|uniref:Uncharacterized protein n=1 Tax=Streptomyces formicae TaxID=1616117 RepID=A0A291QLI7_9ACTN|nr:hypothetical protein [Streptomyces formicae]ATL32397.1 hypothetical protein KY5_7379 [Streptomyces formicae]